MKTNETSIAVRVTGLSKKYRLGTASPYVDIKRGIKRMIKRLLRMQPAPIFEDGQTLWALKNVSFEVKKGEVVGVIGRNGAGKSTLLKILSRVTAPTEGGVDIYGRIGALLEVGTGFHPDLTGRENIFLNGSIIGMTNQEITERFDVIVAFAELEKFIDTPVKHYSSGMYMRLAFAVSSHLSHEILVLDEVLSVGDSAFQQKCLAKMENEANSGRTIIFVSHDLGSVIAFCDRCLLIEKGEITMDGDPAAVVARYQERSALSFHQTDNFSNADDDNSDFRIVSEHAGIPEPIREALSRGQRFGEGQARFTSYKLSYTDAAGRPSPLMRTGYDLEIELSIEVQKSLREATVAAHLCDRSGGMVTDFSTAMKRTFIHAEPSDKITVRFNAKNLRLKPDSYRLSIWIGRYAAFDADCIPMAAKLIVEMNPEIMKYPEVNFLGVYVCEFSSEIVRAEQSAQLVGSASES